MPTKQELHVLHRIVPVGGAHPRSEITSVRQAGRTAVHFAGSIGRILTFRNAIEP